MNLPVDVKIDDYPLAMKMKNSLTLGHYFAFVDAKTDRGRGRVSRLLVEPTPSHRVIPLVGESFSVAGMTLTPRKRSIDPLGAVVTDRDLYRAEQDTVYLFVAVPEPPKGLALVVEWNGEPLTSRKLDLEDGVGIETLSMLLPGDYQAQLSVDGRKIGTPVDFTVAEYTLAPLTGRLVSHELDRSDDTLSFEVAVESYQVPFDGELEVSIVDQIGEVSSTRMKAEAPGCYVGRLIMKGEGPFRLQLVSTEDAERVAQVAIPGSRESERDMTVIGELGKEQLFSMMPQPDALPLRGGFLTEGDFLATPLVVEEPVSDRFVLHAKQDLQTVRLVVLDLASGEMSVVHHGDAKSGDEIVVDTESSLCTVFAGAVVNGKPFEGYSSFFRPSRLTLELEVPETVRPGDELNVQLVCKGASKAVPVLLAVRDHRLTTADRPSVSLGASAKKTIDAAVEGMDEGFFDSGAILPPPPMRMTRARAMVGGVEPRFVRSESFEPMSAFALEETSEDFDAVAGGVEDTGAFPLGGDVDSPTEPPRADFPSVLFYGLVPVSGSREVSIPVGDTLGSFAVEAFALIDGDWTDARSTVVVDKPVRVDLELPPAVHKDDKVVGRLRVSTSSGRGKVRLTRDGAPVPLRGADSDVVETPAELELEVVSGTYVAIVEDLASGETDAVEITVGEPGVLKSYVKELGLLLAGDHITLDSADALTLRVLPAVDESFHCLLSATAGYAHLCCEQTAAKILAATFMYLASESDGERRNAKEIILAGIEREKKMIRPGRGFVMYPEIGGVNDYYSRATVRYLWNLHQLGKISELSPDLRRAASEGTALADQAAEAHGIERLPRDVQSAADAYAAATSGDASSAEKYFAEALDFSGDDVTVQGNSGRVDSRATLAYAAASFIAMSQLEKGVRLANQVTRQFNEQGRLYSTLDSVAAIVLMIQLRSSGLVSGEGRLRGNGKEMTALDATSSSDQMESVEVLEGVAAVELTRVHEEDWNKYDVGFPVRVGFRDKSGNKATHFRMGDKAELVVTLPDGYQVGDLAHVSLPASMSWIQGGGKVKQFSMDFEGRDELRIPLIVTSKIEGQQHFALCVRNMFEEERVTNPGLLTVKAAS